MVQPRGFQWPQCALFVPHPFPSKHLRIKRVPPEVSRSGTGKARCYTTTLEMRVSSPQLIRFGLFEVDTRSGELRRQGSKVNLQEQPFQALVLLLERRGEVVTREELNKRLWPENTFVDFERGLNKVINKLRTALRDDAEKPRFIETLPQRGYRFIAPLEGALPGSPP